MDVNSTELVWGIKRSFREYVDGAEGTVRPPVPLPDPFRFAGQAGSFVNGAQAELRFAGEVQFDAHLGMLKLRITDPWIHISGTEATLSIRDPGSLKSDPRRLVFADLSISADTLTAGTPIRSRAMLADTGVGLFRGSYKIGEELDELSFGFTL